MYVGDSQLSPCMQSRVYRKRQVIAIRDEAHSQREDSPFDSPPCKCPCVCHGRTCNLSLAISDFITKNICLVRAYLSEMFMLIQ